MYLHMKAWFHRFSGKVNGLYIKIRKDSRITDSFLDLIHFLGSYKYSCLLLPGVSSLVRGVFQSRWGYDILQLPSPKETPIVRLNLLIKVNEMPRFDREPSPIQEEENGRSQRSIEGLAWTCCTVRCKTFCRV